MRSIKERIKSVNCLSSRGYDFGIDRIEKVEDMAGHLDFALGCMSDRTTDILIIVKSGVSGKKPALCDHLALFIRKPYFT